MDALSAAGSIVGLVELSATVFNAICRFTKDVKDAKAEVGELAKEIRDLSGTLHSLSLLARTLEDQDPFASLQAHRLHACRRTLLKIQDRVYKAQTDFERGRKRDLVLRSIAWPFSKHETQELLDELARHKATISLALSADTMSTLLGILSTQTTLEAGLRDVKKDFRQMFEADTRVKLDQKRQEILQFFSKVNPRIAHQTALSLRQPMTGLWLLDGAKFLDWKATRNSKLWLGGTAGSGKTVLCGGLVDTILQESCPTVAVAYFYCDYKNTASQSPVITLGSIAAQIARQHVTAFDLLQEMYDEHHPKDGLEKPMDATSLCEVIQAMAQNFDRVFIVVDALDECGSQTGDMLESLKTIAECAVVSIALFSRTEQDIRESLADDFSFLEIAAQTQDLEIFVGVEMSRRKGLKDLQIKDPTLNEDVRRKLVHGADGMFRWVACQLDYLSSLPTNSRRRAALQMLPPSLNKTYERILEHVSTTSPDPESRIMIQRALWWIGTASPPLTIPQICEAVSFNDAQTWMDPNDIIEEAAILRSCSSLIRKTHDNQSFEFAHFTVLQYLESISCDSPLRSFRLSQETSSLSLAITSLKFLLLPQFDIYPVAEVSEFDRMDERDTRHPFYMYAASNWFRYTDPRLNDPTPRALVEALFSLERTGNFLSWVVCFSDIRNLDSAGFSVNKYKSLTAILQSNLSPLHLAASLGQPALCQRLIDLKADVNQRSWFGTPLHFALSGPEILSLRSTPAVNKTGDVPGTVGILLERGAQSDALWASYSPLYLALKWCMHYRDAGAVLPLVAHATAYQRDALDLFRLLCDNSGAHQFVYEILSKIISVSTTVKIGEMSAQMEKYVSIAKQFQLSMKQMDPKPISKANFASTICDADFSNALHSAIIHDRDDEFADLIADPRFSKSQTAEFLEFGRTVAHVAAIKSAEKVMKRLIQQGLELDRQDEMGATPMHLCSSDRKLPILKLLLDEKVSSVVQDKNGETVWHLACGFDSPGVMEALLSQDDGVKSKALKIVSREGRTPIAEALYQGNDHLAMEILPHCPKGPEYLVSDVPVLSLSSRSGSEDLLRAVRKQLRSSSTQFPIEGLTSPFHVRSLARDS
ncbi:hypothetical protein B0T19DRAFT_353277 [Cercophora scortea]|uniref:Uncharacterized protein n=1 Tax=Cercophora scortea TaxID=314031 RepID=A0AAE0IXC7_9PEZI|nr:hypothetical protein B0T19DRAFT_353277 [Cercophora scortea]